MRWRNKCLLFLVTLLFLDSDPREKCQTDKAHDPLRILVAAFMQGCYLLSVNQNSRNESGTADHIFEPVGITFF